MYRNLLFALLFLLPGVSKAEDALFDCKLGVGFAQQLLTRHANPEELKQAAARLRKVTIVQDKKDGEFRAITKKGCADEKSQIMSMVAALEQNPEWTKLDESGSLIRVHAPSVPSFVDEYQSLEFNVLGWPQIPLDEMLERPTDADILANYPDLARRRSIFGVILLEGRAENDGSFVWRVIETPQRLAGYRFEDAAIKVASHFKAPPKLKDGHSTTGLAFIASVSFISAVKREVRYY